MSVSGGCRGISDEQGADWRQGARAGDAEQWEEIILWEFLKKHIILVVVNDQSLF